MAEAISDKQVVAVLRPFVRGCAPIVDALRESGKPKVDKETTGDGEQCLRDRLREGLNSIHVPGTTAWARMSVDERTDWWVHRVGRLTALVASVPGLGGALADRLPVQDALGAASQGVLLCAIAGEHGITEVPDRVRLIGWVLFGRDLDPKLAAGKQAGEDAETAQLTEELDESNRKHGKYTVKATARTLWRLGRMLFSISDELEKRPSGRFYHHAVGALPVVGMAGKYFGERAGLKKVAKRARGWISRAERVR